MAEAGAQPRLTHPDAGWALRAIKALHTAVWAFFAGAIVAIPVLAWRGEFMWVGAATAAVLLEVAVLALNAWRCPLTDAAASFTRERRANFDIYLPLWLATYNKQVFGALFVAGLLFALARAVTR